MPWLGRRQIAEKEMELQRAIERAAHLTGQLEAQARELVRLQALVTEMALRPPVVLEAPKPPEISIPAILEAVSKLFTAPATIAQDASQAKAWTANQEDTGLKRQWFPDAEFDEFLESQGDVWPTRGGWVRGNQPAMTSPGAPTDDLPSHEAGNGSG